MSAPRLGYLRDSEGDIWFMSAGIPLTDSVHGHFFYSDK
jgi:hypothetical protein